MQKLFYNIIIIIQYKVNNLTKKVTQRIIILLPAVPIKPATEASIES